MVELYGDTPVACIASVGAGRGKTAEFRTPTGWKKVFPKDLIYALAEMATDYKGVTENNREVPS